MQYPSIIRIGTRQSKLATAQAESVRGKLMAALPGVKVELVPMVTSGDKNTDRSLADIGGKGLFTKELEEGLLGGTLDIAVHSLKDMETHLRTGLIIAAVLEREDPRDALLAPDGQNLGDLKKGAKVGTSSMRRAAQLKMVRPDLTIIPLRGNVPTRITKLKNGEADAIVLALAGLKRLGLEHEASEILDTERFIPAVGQGVIAIECREENTAMHELLQAIHHEPTYIATLCERSLLATLDGSCRTPIGGFAQIKGDQLHLRAMIAKIDGSKHLNVSGSGAITDALEIGDEAAQDLLVRGGKEFLI